MANEEVLKPIEDNQRDVISIHKKDIIEKQKIFDSCKDRMIQDTRSAQMVQIAETLFELLEMHIQLAEYMIGADTESEE